MIASCRRILSISFSIWLANSVRASVNSVSSRRITSSRAARSASEAASCSRNSRTWASSRSNNCGQVLGAILVEVERIFASLLMMHGDTRYYQWLAECLRVLDRGAPPFEQRWLEYSRRTAIELYLIITINKSKKFDGVLK